MSSKIFLGVRFPPKYERFQVNVDLNKDIENLQTEFSKQTELPENGIVFLYCGQPLQDGKTLNEQGIKTGSTIHVLKKICKPPPSDFEKFTEVDVAELVTKFRSIKAASFHKATTSEFVKKVLESHPEIRNDLAAMAILKDPILLATMRNPETIRLLAEHHRCLINAGPTIVDFLKTTSTPPNQVVATAEDQLSDTSSESEASPSTSTGNRPGVMRRFTTEQLASALNFAGTSSRNSLASISQRNLNQPAGDATTSNNPTPTRITNSMFMNALSEVLLSTRQQTGSNAPAQASAAVEASGESPVTVAPEPTAADATSTPMYLTELQQMREMGLTDTEINLQALMITNGDIEAAVNLVFSGMNN